MSTFHSDETETSALADIRAFFVSMAPYIHDDILWQFPNAGDVVDLATGQNVGTWTQPEAAQLQATAGGAVAAGVGVRVVWETGGFTNGRRVRGATFLTSLQAERYQSDGTIAALTLSGMQTAVSTLVGHGWLRILGRGIGGAKYTSFGVVSGRVPDKVAWLTSRRQ